MIQLEKVDFAYNKAERAMEIPILQQVDFTFAEGKRYLLSGKNGVGKSTLLQLLARNLRPTGGKIIYRRPQLEQLKLAAVTPLNTVNNSSLNFTVAEFCRNIVQLRILRDSRQRKFSRIKDLFGRKRQEVETGGNSVAYFRERLAKLTERLDLSACYQRQLKELSQGQYQKLLLIRAILAEADVYLLDEPTAFMDRKSAELLPEILQEFLAPTCLLLLVSHEDPSLFAAYNKIKLQNRQLTAEV